jgi:hypothetical protein
MEGYRVVVAICKQGSYLSPGLAGTVSCNEISPMVTKGDLRGVFVTKCNEMCQFGYPLRDGVSDPPCCNGRERDIKCWLKRDGARESGRTY